jgi:hypothetical protein
VIGLKLEMVLTCGGMLGDQRIAAEIGLWGTLLELVGSMFSI